MLKRNRSIKLYYLYRVGNTRFRLIL